MAELQVKFPTTEDAGSHGLCSAAAISYVQAGAMPDTYQAAKVQLSVVALDSSIPSSRVV